MGGVSGVAINTLHLNVLGIRMQDDLPLAASVDQSHGLLPVPILRKPVLDNGNRGWDVVISGRPS